MLLRRKHVITSLVITTSVMVIPLVSAGTAQAEVPARCGPGFHIATVLDLKNDRGERGPGRLKVWHKSGSDQICAKTVRTGKARGVRGETAVHISDTRGNARHDVGQFMYYAGAITQRGPGCAKVSGSLKYKGVTYKATKTAWCDRKNNNGKGFELPRKNPHNVDQMLRYVRHEVHTGPSRNWHEMCLNFTARAYGWNHSGSPRAIDHWNSTPRSMKHPGDRTPKVGALVYWRTSHPAGHVAIYVGNGNIASTDMPTGRVGIVPMSAVTSKWGGHYLGWTSPYYPKGF